MLKDRLTYSIIIPVYNEERAIIPTLRRIESYFQKNGSGYEVVMVNDGSTDATAARITGEISGKPNLRLLGNSRNEGKGAAVRKGILDSRGDYLLFMDADMSTPIEELDNIIGSAAAGEIIIGVRDEKAENKNINRPAARKFVSMMYNFSANVLFGLKIGDIGCGFKFFPAGIARGIFEKQKIKGWVFDTELLLRARKMGIPIKEVPVSWSNHFVTRVNVIPDSLYCAFDLLRIFYYNLFNRL
jgi:dolichyl-phosphate beta-glucosyltransferase